MLSSTNNEFISMYSPKTYQIYLEFVGQNNYPSTLPVLVKLKYNYYIVVIYGHQIELIYGG